MARNTKALSMPIVIEAWNLGQENVTSLDLQMMQVWWMDHSNIGVSWKGIAQMH